MDSLNEKNSRRYSRGYGKRKYEFNEKSNILWVDYDYLEDIENFQLIIYQSNVRITSYNVCYTKLLREKAAQLRDRIRSLSQIQHRQDISLAELKDTRNNFV